jgi:hypothetical protein
MKLVGPPNIVELMLMTQYYMWSERLVLDIQDLAPGFEPAHAATDLTVQPVLLLPSGSLSFLTFHFTAHHLTAHAHAFLTFHRASRDGRVEVRRAKRAAGAQLFGLERAAHATARAGDGMLRVPHGRHARHVRRPEGRRARGQGRPVPASSPGPDRRHPRWPHREPR